MAAGAQFDDPELFFTGVNQAVHGHLQRRIGADQAQRVADALRLQWAGLTQETKGKILRQWGEWTDDPVAMAQGVVDLAQGKLERYAGSTGLHASTKLSQAATTVNDKTADAARQALADVFGQNPA
jgi:uncharacterized protein YjbJ (UPF0337 family)